MSAVETQPSRSLAVGSFHGEFCFFPRFPTTWNVPKLIESFRLQNAGGDAGAISASAVNRCRFATMEFANPSAQLREKNMACARNPPSFPFSRRTNIENLKRRFPFVKFMHAHLPDFLERKSCCVPRLHSTNQVTRKLRVTRADKQPHDFFEVVIAF